jgi:hypothetical protein
MHLGRNNTSTGVSFFNPTPSGYRESPVSYLNKDSNQESRIFTHLEKSTLLRPTSPNDKATSCDDL